MQRTIQKPQALIDAAKSAGMSVPDNVVEYDKNEFPHWHFFVNIRIGRPLKDDQSHIKNAVVISKADRDHLNFLDLESRLE